jgi:hypothetical protein
MSRGRFALGSVSIAVSLIFAGFNMGCAAQDSLLRSDHFTVTLPRSWEVVRVPGPTTEPAVVRVPRGAVDNATSGTSLELYVYPWLARRTIEQPTQEVLRRLVSDGVLDLQSATPASGARCSDFAGQFRMLGALEAAVHLETPTGDHVIVVGGQSRGSLIAMIGVVTGRGSLCDNVGALQTAMRTMGSRLAGYDPTDHPRLPTPRIAPLPQRSEPELPSATML